MTRFKVFQIFVFLTLISFVTPSKLIYRKYEKKHPKRNYVQIVEIFETRHQPPPHSQSDKELNDFLARDAYKTDMNCSKGVEQTTQAPVTLPTIPTTAYRRITPTTRLTTTMKSPNLNDLFTISVRSTKPTIRPNPKENQNPDYTNVVSWPTPNVQATKHSAVTNTPTIVIIAPDDQPKQDQTTVKDIDKELSKAATTPSNRPELEDDEIIYPNSEEGNYGDYDIIKSDEVDLINGDVEPANEGEYGDNSEYEQANDDYQDRKRRRRHRVRAAIQKRKNSTKN